MKKITIREDVQIRDFLLEEGDRIEVLEEARLYDSINAKIVAAIMDGTNDKERNDAFQKVAEGISDAIGLMMTENEVAKEDGLPQPFGVTRHINVFKKTILGILSRKAKK